VEHSEYAPVERVLAQPIADSTRAVWGFQNRTDFVTLATAIRRCFSGTGTAKTLGAGFR